MLGKGGAPGIVETGGSSSPCSRLRIEDGAGAGMVSRWFSSRAGGHGVAALSVSGLGGAGMVGRSAAAFVSQTRAISDSMEDAGASSGTESGGADGFMA